MGEAREKVKTLLLMVVGANDAAIRFYERLDL